MSNDKQNEIRAIREQLKVLDDQRATLEMELEAKELEALISGGLHTGSEPASGLIGGQDPDIVNSIYIGDKPEFKHGQLRVYRRVVAARTRWLPLHAFGHAATRRGPSTLALAPLYVCLNTDLRASEATIAMALKAVRRGQTDPFPPERSVTKEAEVVRPLRAMEAAILRRSQVLLGAPGSGKTTFLNYLANALATGDEKRLAGWPAAERHYLPVLLNLRDLAAWIAANGDNHKSSSSLIWGFILHDLRERNLSFAADPLHAALKRGETLLLMDGLDEVPLGTLRAVRDSIKGCVDRYPNGRYLVTCRVLTYQQPQWHLAEDRFPMTGLAPLEDHQIDRFIGAWYAETSGKGPYGKALAEERADALRQAVRRPVLRVLAHNPMLLTVMALVHTHRGELPEARARLYEEALDILLWHWEQTRGSEEEGLTDLLRVAERDRGDLVSLLERLAYEVHGEDEPQSRTHADECELFSGIGEQDLITALRGLHPKKHLDWAQRVADLLKLRAGLLVEIQPGSLCFLHQTFQEYLAGSYLAHSCSFPERAVALSRHWSMWRDAILFGVGFLVHNQRETQRPLSVVESLCPPHTPENDTEWRDIWLSGEILLEMGPSRAIDLELGSQLLGKVRPRLSALIERGALHARERAEAGDVLGRLGDVRFDRARFRLPAHFRGDREKSIGLVPIKPGRFVMGSREDDPEAQVAELGNPSPLSIDYRFWIARYPVTVAELDAFVKAGGYDAPEWWTDQGWSWRRALKREEPSEWVGQIAFANRPAVGVTWFEAMAYARWIDSQLRQRTTHVLPDYRVRLPTEAEWERVARGAAGRRYAWGDEWDDARANVAETINHASVVGMYPQGATHRGVMDLTGNVWEWCLTGWEDYPYQPGDGRNDPDSRVGRVLRGGSWLRDRRFARCACRIESLPKTDARDIGFRLVLSRSQGAF